MTFSEHVDFLRAMWKREEGQTMTEYAVVLAVINVAAVAVFLALSGGVQGALSNTVGVL